MLKWLSLILALGLLAAAYQVSDWYQQPLDLPAEEWVLTVNPGDSMGAIASRLEADGVLEHATLLKAYARLISADTAIHAGEYRIEAGTTPGALLQLLVSGEVIQYAVTLPEGITLREALLRMAAHPALSGIDSVKTDILVPGYSNPEGWFFPDTYKFQRGDSALALLARSHARMNTVLEEAWSARAAGLPYRSAYEALIMASIIEKETAVGDERPLIAGVFVRRLQMGMRLQTDPTIIYGIGPDFDGDIRRRDLLDGSNPYNTYRIDGLPPTPIALPGKASIEAALNPTETEALYFVAKGDGSHYFSKTLAEHEAAVRRYQLR